jgi:hypothetical protein
LLLVIPSWHLYKLLQKYLKYKNKYISLHIQKCLLKYNY